MAISAAFGLAKANRFYGFTGRVTSNIIIAIYKVMEARPTFGPSFKCLQINIYEKKSPFYTGMDI